MGFGLIDTVLLTCITDALIYNLYREYYSWVRGNTRFISSVERDISRVSA